MSLLGAINIGDFCTQTKDILQLVGYVLLVFKVAIPILIIALGMFDFGKAVVADKDDEIKKQTKKLLFRVISGIVIFFIPTIVMFLFSLIGGYNTDREQAEFDVCETCVLHPGQCR